MSNPAVPDPSFPPNAWWSTRDVQQGAGARWEVGPLTVIVAHRDDEWQVAYARADPAEDPGGWSFEAYEGLSELETVERFAAGPTSSEICLHPHLPDRAVVARPRVPLHVLPGHRARIFVATPVWVAVVVGKDRRQLTEVPSRVLSDSWFGSTTVEGELVYSLRTQARNRWRDIPPHSHRVITPVVVRNDAPDHLSVERISIPVPYLSVFAGESHLWTAELVLRRHESSGHAVVEIGAGAPPEAAGTARLLSPPRVKPEQSLLVRAFGSLVRPFMDEGS